MDQVKDSKNTDELWAEKMTIMQAMKKLNEKEKTIIQKRFFDGRTQMEVADEIRNFTGPSVSFREKCNR